MKAHIHFINKTFVIPILVLVLCATGAKNESVKNKYNEDDPRESFISDIPDYPGNIILSRPTNHSITLSVISATDRFVNVLYGQMNNKLTERSEEFELTAGEPREILISNLKPNSFYSYRVVDSNTQKPFLPINGNGMFHTQRARGESFTFTVQADSHLDGDCLPELYKATLDNVLNSKPDFHIDLGDTFMTGKILQREVAAKQYLAQRYWFGTIGHSVPIFLVLGNHDGEEIKKKSSNRANGLAVWSCIQRKRYFPNPIPDDFYSGNTEKQQHAGYLQNYYSWQWGDALFIVLDPYWYSGSTRGGQNPWNMTIGKTQYDWLSETLRNSRVRFKFVFIHQLVGGLDRSARGGAEAATLFEWGGSEKSGRQNFAMNRPGWEKPIHTLLKENGVDIVFHGHDHFFARQEFDGIIYQLVPQPSHRNFRNHHAKEYGYVKGDFLPNSGHIQVKVSPQEIEISYIRSAVNPMQKRGIKNGETYFKYSRNP